METQDGTTQENPDKAAKKDEADPFEFAMKVIINHCRGIYECCLSIHYFKEVWLIQCKSTAQKLLDHGLDQERNRLSATASTFIELTRRWAKMIVSQSCIKNNQRSFV
ncbi:unnamed protein product [Auanema sp. JU1783]|nr:unnamed protein product [Auanema sp. JU1783]